MTNVSIIVGRNSVNDYYKHGFRKFIKQNKKDSAIGIGYFATDLSNWHDRANVYICAEEYTEFSFVDGYCKNGKDAYSDFAGMVPVSCICLYLNDNGSYSISFIETNNEYKNKGYSKIVIAAMIKWLKENNITKIHRTNPSEDGEKYTMNNITNALNAAGISFSVWKM